MAHQELPGFNGFTLLLDTRGILGITPSQHLPQGHWARLHHIHSWDVNSLLNSSWEMEQFAPVSSSKAHHGKAGWAIKTCPLHAQ